ncbi:MAG TPA: Nramp family divalent metal transporter [Vicinamibacterales bacterium]|nr:Nramp family divalent metal transporter [Vicinamibacterales bacterium]
MSRAVEARSGLPAWQRADLPDAPRPVGFGWLGAVGPGVIVLGASIGSGEFLLGPAVFVRYGLTLLWITAVAVWLQTIFNTELMRYTLATGEPVFTGFMRTRPRATFWAWFYSLLYFVQSGWPAWAANAAGAVFFLIARRLATPDDAAAVYYIGVATFGLCVAVLLVGRRIERTLELLNWVAVVCILGTLLILAVIFVPGRIWVASVAGLAGYDTAGGGFVFLPGGMDFVLLAALAGYAGAGGITNITLANWARDRGYGMSERCGYIPAAVGGHKTALAHSGFMFEPTPANLARWRGWWRIVNADQWGVFFAGGIVGMVLPAMLYVTILPSGTDIRGLAIAAELASGIGARAGALMAGVVALLAAWVLVKTQLDQLEGMVRAITDILWAGSARIRTWRGGDVRAVYYTVLAATVIWGVFALQLAAPIVLLQLGANIAGVVFVIASLHLLYLNTVLLPPALRPPTWRRATLVGMAGFYGFFTVMSIRALTGS